MPACIHFTLTTDIQSYILALYDCFLYYLLFSCLCWCLSSSGLCQQPGRRKYRMNLSLRLCFSLLHPFTPIRVFSVDMSGLHVCLCVCVTPGTGTCCLDTGSVEQKRLILRLPHTCTWHCGWQIGEGGSLWNKQMHAGNNNWLVNKWRMKLFCFDI